MESPQISPALMFNPSRFPTLTWKQTIALIVYFPFGTVLGVVRGLIWLFIMVPIWALVQNTRFGVMYLKILSFAADIISDILKKQPQARIIAMNHRTDVDVLGVWHLPLCVLISPYIGRIVGWFQKLGFNIEVIFTRKEQTSTSDEETKRQVRDSIASQLKTTKGYLYTHPEGATTNGKGVLLFNKFLFGLGETVQPVALDFYIPFFEFLPVHVDHLFDNWVANFFFILFHPCVVYEYTFLPPQRKLETESDKDFADRIQNMIAKELRIPATNYTFKDKNALRKNWKPFM